MKVKKIIRSSWNDTIPSKIGDAGVWKPNCQFLIDDSNETVFKEG